MAPIRRYLRISKHSVLECRIFLENPADESRWLLRERDPALPRVFEAIKPYVLPKLREENERAKGKGKKKKSVKDVVKQGIKSKWKLMCTNDVPDDFEVSIFLTEIRTRHSLLVKNKTFQKRPSISTNNGGKLTGVDRDTVTIQDEENDDDEHINLGQIPHAEDSEQHHDRDSIFGMEADDDKKKLGLRTTYEGFSIWGWVLCLFVERKGGLAVEKSSSGIPGNAQALMQDWIASTQAQKDDDDL